MKSCLQPFGKCASIDEIRACIDSIDKAIITNLALRSTYVKRAAGFKKSMSDVKADDRVKAMLEIRRKWAVENDISPDFVASLFQSIVHYFISGETKEWLKENQP